MALFGKGLLSKKRASKDEVQPQKVQPQQTQQEAPASLELHASEVFLNQTAATRDDALKLVASKMQERSLVAGDYSQALIARENKVSTYLVNGVAIPHGVLEAKKQVTTTGIVVLQFPEGVVWNDSGCKVHVAVGIAAKGEEHIALLQQLSKVVMNKEQTQQLAQTQSVADVVRILNGASAQENETLEDFAIKGTAVIVDEAGIHARPASKLAEIASEYQDCSIRIRNNDKAANAKSMAELLTLAA